LCCEMMLISNSNCCFDATAEQPNIAPASLVKDSAVCQLAQSRPPSFISQYLPFSFFPKTVLT
jgi:hypothetical protein